VVHEEEVLRDLRTQGVPVAKVLANFEIEEHRYLAMEFIEGDNLMALCSHPRRKLPLATADALAARVADIVAEIHGAGWVWRDCKPLNLIASNGGDVRPVDFEGAVRVDAPSSIVWGTRGYTPPELNQGPVTGSNLPEDLFALGATLHQIYTSLVPVAQEPGKEPQSVERRPVGSMRRGVHPETRKMIARLLDGNPLARPSAREAATELLKRLPAKPIVIDASKHRRRLMRKDILGRQLPLADDLPGVEPVVLKTPNSRKLVAA
jgi:serine/threonine protein kinase